MRPVASEADSGDAAIAFRGVRKAFRGHLGIGRVVAVDGLDLVVRPGEVFGLLGPNGAGKTTTIKMLTGLVQPDAGKIRLFGKPPSDPAARAAIGFLPENPYFYTYLTAAEFLDFYARLRGLGATARREMVPRMLQRVGLAEKATTPLGKFSKGMVQRLGLAQAIQHDPELVILDEPMSGLDPIGRRDVRDLILELRRAGKTVFFSSHILQDAELICDRVAILDRGRVITSGRLDDLVSSQVSWYEVAIRGALPERLPATVVSRDGGETLLRVDEVESLEALMAAVRASGGQVVSLWPCRETLEDLFLRKLQHPVHDKVRTR